jgi:hypothetical protein
MLDPQNFLDNLENLQLVMSVAFEHVHENRGRFVKDATREEVRHGERLIREVRNLAGQLGEELNALERAIAKARTKRSQSGGRT